VSTQSKTGPRATVSNASLATRLSKVETELAEVIAVLKQSFAANAAQAAAPQIMAQLQQQAMASLDEKGLGSLLPQSPPTE